MARLGLLMSYENSLERNRCLEFDPFDNRFCVWDQERRVNDHTAFRANDQRSDAREAFLTRGVDMGFELP